jgi:hypothetical protein
MVLEWICHVQHFYVATYDDSKCLPEDVHALLTFPKALVTLSFSWLNYKFKSGPRRRFTRKISNHQTWSALQQHADSLETLDLVHRINKSHHFTKDHFDSLISFVRLKTLSIQAQVLLGDDFSYLTTCLAPACILLPWISMWYAKKTFQLCYRNWRNMSAQMLLL